MILANLTPHDVNLITEGVPIIVLPSGIVARVQMKRVRVGSLVIADIEVPIHQVKIGDVYDLPDPQSDTFYIVSRIVAEACPKRTDLLMTDDAVRDDKGQVIGCCGFARVNSRSEE